MLLWEGSTVQVVAVCVLKINNVVRKCGDPCRVIRRRTLHFLDGLKIENASEVWPLYILAEGVKLMYEVRVLVVLTGSVDCNAPRGASRQSRRFFSFKKQ